MLNTLNASGLPPHALHLKIGALVILLRNLELSKLCNGTLIVVKKLFSHVMRLQFLKERHERTGIQIKDTTHSIRFGNTHCFAKFPLTFCFAMSVSNGQLCVGSIRVGSKSNLFAGKTEDTLYREVF